jgi:hypothetical protein
MKQTFYFALFTLILLCSTCCQKETLDNSTLPTALIKTEACFSPDCMTLILAHPSNDFFDEDSEKHEIGWLKNIAFYRNESQLSCTHSALYKAIMRFIYSNQVKE